MADEKPQGVVFVDVFESGVASWSNDLRRIYALARQMSYEVRDIFIVDTLHPQAFETMMATLLTCPADAVFAPYRVHLDNQPGDRTRETRVLSICKLITLEALPTESVGSIS